MRKADTSLGRCPPESERVSLESARRGELNGIGFEASARVWPGPIAIRESPDGPHWSRLAEGNRMP